MAKLGHSVGLVTNTSRPGAYLGVDCFNHQTADYGALFNDAEAVIIVNEAIGGRLRDMGFSKPLILWTGHAEDQPAMKALEFSRERKAWTAFAFVSQWQLERYKKAFWIASERSRIMRNAAAPFFVESAPARAWFQHKEAPVLAYTSAPHRGLDVLLAAFPRIRRAMPGAILRVFSGLSTNRGQAGERQYEILHAQCLATEGVEYVGPVPQRALADVLSTAAALAYPSTFAETSCIAAMEAMASGAAVFATNLGALPETLAGFGGIVEFRQDRISLANEFAQMAIRGLQDMRGNSKSADAARNARIAFAREHYAWPSRALEWQSWLNALVKNTSA